MKEMIGGRTARERRKKILYHEAAHGKITGELRAAAEDWLQSGMPEDVRERLTGRLKRDFRNKKHPYWQPGGLAEEIAADVIAAREGKGMNRLKAWFGLEGEELDRLTALSDGDPVPAAAIGPFSLGDDPNDDPFWGRTSEWRHGRRSERYARSSSTAGTRRTGRRTELKARLLKNNKNAQPVGGSKQPSQQPTPILLRDPDNRWNIANLNRAATDMSVAERSQRQETATISACPTRWPRSTAYRQRWNSEPRSWHRRQRERSRRRSYDVERGRRQSRLLAQEGKRPRSTPAVYPAAPRTSWHGRRRLNKHIDDWAKNYVKSIERPAGPRTISRKLAG